MNKGQFEAMPVIFGILLAGIGIITFSLLKYPGYLNIRGIVEENEAERHAMLLAHVFSSLPNLTYSDGETFYRTIFKKEKIDGLMIKQQEFVHDWQNKLYPGILSDEVGYSDSYSVVILHDLETNQNWITVIAGPEKNFSVNKFVNCLIDNRKCEVFDAMTGECIAYVSMNKLFEIGSGTWNVFDVDACVSIFDSLYNVTLYYSKTGISFHGFPVSISSDEEIHHALLKVWVIEV